LLLTTILPVKFSSVCCYHTILPVIHTCSYVTGPVSYHGYTDTLCDTGFYLNTLCRYVHIFQRYHHHRDTTPLRCTARTFLTCRFNSVYLLHSTRDIPRFATVIKLPRCVVRARPADLPYCAHRSFTAFCCLSTAISTAAPPAIPFTFLFTAIPPRSGGFYDVCAFLHTYTCRCCPRLRCFHHRTVTVDVQLLTFLPAARSVRCVYLVAFLLGRCSGSVLHVSTVTYTCSTFIIRSHNYMTGYHSIDPYHSLQFHLHSSIHG